MDKLREQYSKFRSGMGTVITYEQWLEKKVKKLEKGLKSDAELSKQLQISDPVNYFYG